MDDRLYLQHEALEDTHWWFVGKNTILAALIRRYAPRPRGVARPRLLDIGCGAGGLMRRLADDFDPLGIDDSPLALAAATRRGLRVLAGRLPDALPVGPADDRFEVVVLSEVLEHVRDDRAALAAACDRLAPGGLLVCTVPAHPWLWSRHDELNHHVRRYTGAGFARLFDGLPLTALVASPYNTGTFPAVATARLLQRLHTPGPERDDLRLPPRPVNRLLASLFAAERHWLPHVRLPVGVSFIVLHRRLSDPPSRGEALAAASGGHPPGGLTGL